MGNIKSIILSCLFMVTLGYSQEKFGNLSIKLDTKESKKWTTAKVYVDDSTSTLRIYELKAMPLALNNRGKTLQLDDLLVFEPGNPYTTKLAIVTEDLSVQHMDFMRNVRDALQNGQKDGDKTVALSQKEMENIVITIAKWLSDKKISAK